MITTMTGSIIGGAIAAVIGLLGALGIEMWREHRREKALRKSIIKELMAEIEENIKLSSEIQPGKPNTFEITVWKSSYIKLSFLPTELRYVLRQAYRQAEERGHLIEVSEQRVRIVSQELRNSFMLCKDKLQRWIDSN